jgi:hypothetical protein
VKTLAQVLTEATGITWTSRFPEDAWWSREASATLDTPVGPVRLAAADYIVQGSEEGESFSTFSIVPEGTLWQDGYHARRVGRDVAWLMRRAVEVVKLLRASTP